MNQETLLSIISHGESPSVEFKREINLDNSQQKAEFIKDIIALANSVRENGYMLVGVSNDKALTGIPYLEEERIQEIIQTYISPPLNVICDYSNISKIGIIEVYPTQKPYKVARAIDRVERNQVFIRHGSVVAKASPEEIIMMDKESQIRLKSSEHLNVARKHVELGNFESAVRAYTELLDMYPEQDWFLERANAYVNILYTVEKEQIRKISFAALKDFDDALVLTKSSENEKTVRFARLRATYRILNKQHKLGLEKIWGDDIKWLKDYVSGKEYGEIIFLELANQVNDIGRFDGSYYQTLEKAIELGYKDKSVYLTRAAISFIASNFGFALMDIEKFLEEVTEKDEKVKGLCLKGELLLRLHEYTSSYSCFEQARRISATALSKHNFHLMMGFPHSTIYGLCIEYEFNNNESNIWRVEGFLNSTLRSLINMYAAGMSLKEFREMYAPVLATIIDIVGQEFWLSIKWQWTNSDV